MDSGVNGDLGVTVLSHVEVEIWRDPGPVTLLLLVMEELPVLGRVNKLEIATLSPVVSRKIYKKVENYLIVVKISVPYEH